MMNPSASASASCTAAVKIQCAYRAYRVRYLVKLLASVNHEANRLQSLIQDQDTVDAIRRRQGDDDKIRIRINEALMRLLLKLDSVPGFDPAVRDIRRSLSRRIIGLQDILDLIAQTPHYDHDFDKCDFMALIQQATTASRTRNDDDDDDDEIGKGGGGGGYEVERFCAENFGFPCLQRFLQ